MHGRNLKADIDGAIFAYDYRARLACVMPSRQIVSRKLDPRHSHDTLLMSQVKIVSVRMVESHDACYQEDETFLNRLNPEHHPSLRKV